jgi:hypothetical protein
MTSEQTPTHVAVELTVFNAVREILDALPRGKVNQVATLFEQSQGIVLGNEASASREVLD